MPAVTAATTVTGHDAGDAVFCWRSPPARPTRRVVVGGVQGRGEAPPRQAGFGDTSEATCQTKPLPAISTPGPKLTLPELTPEERQAEREALAEAAARPRRVTVRLTEDSAQVLARLRVRHGISESALMREGLDALDREGDARRAPAPSAPPPPDPGLVALAREVRAIGVNVNQVARVANSTGIGARYVNDLTEKVDRLVALIDSRFSS